MPLYFGISEAVVQVGIEQFRCSHVCDDLMQLYGVLLVNTNLRSTVYTSKNAIFMCGIYSSRYNSPVLSL